MKRHRVKLASEFFGAKVTIETKALIWRTWRLARLLTPGITVGEMLHQMATRAGVQLRRRLRAKGIDYSAVVAPAKPKFKGLSPKPEPREYGADPKES